MPCISELQKLMVSLIWNFVILFFLWSPPLRFFLHYLLTGLILEIFLQFRLCLPSKTAGPNHVKRNLEISRQYNHASILLIFIYIFNLPYFSLFCTSWETFLVFFLIREALNSLSAKSGERHYQLFERQC